MYFDPNGFSNPSNIVVPHGGAEYVQTQCVLADDRFAISTLAFDRNEELLWIGNQGGHVTSYYTSHLQKYTSVQAHATQDIRQIVPIEGGVLHLTATTLRYQLRRGVPIFTHSSTCTTNMQCMLHSRGNRVLLAGHQSKLIDLDLEVCKETSVVDVGDTGCVTLRAHSRFVCAGDHLGRIDLRDPKTLKVEHTLETHTGSLSDFDVQDNLLVTCGFSSRQGQLSVDRFLRMYDLRMMRWVSPIQTLFDPMYLRFLPSGTQRLAVVSSFGQAQLMDTVAFTSPRICMLQVNNPGQMCTSFDISSSGQAIAFGDSSGSIHLFTSKSSSVFNTFSRPTEHADTLAPMHCFPIGDTATPYSMVPMPFVHPQAPLASDWPAAFAPVNHRLAIPIPKDILVTIKMQGPIGYGPNPNTMRRNQVPYKVKVLPAPTKYVLQNVRTQPASEPTRDDQKDIIPKRYRKIDVKYNKLGVEELQFDKFNKTRLAGLEAHLPNAYCNPMLQVLFHLEPLRAVLLSHICHIEFCLSCEMGFLFRMLATSSTMPCQAGNFLRAFRTVPEASALGLILNDLHPNAKSQVDLCALIQSFNCFILHQMHVELLVRKPKEEGQMTHKPFVYKETDFPTIGNCSSSDRKHGGLNGLYKKKNFEEQKKQGNVTEISALFGIQQLHVNCCLTCRREVRRESTQFACNLLYPNTNNLAKSEWSFCDILQRSLSPEHITPAWCDTCNRFSSTYQSRRLKSLPKQLAINTGLSNAQNKNFWRDQSEKAFEKANLSSGLIPKHSRSGDCCSRGGCRIRSDESTANNWVPHNIRLALTNNGLKVESVKEASKKTSAMEEYRLTAVVCHITDQAATPDTKSLVSMILVPPTKQEIDASSKSMNDLCVWYILNDFCITPVTSHEATCFQMDWKVPCVLYYSTAEVLHANTRVERNLNQDMFSQACSVISRSINTPRTFIPLADGEYPRKGDLVAMDAEFVTLTQEESELRSGKMSTVKPSHLSVARITCIRGQGPYEGTPFIDDYISTQEQVVDYLTKFSGIKPGDLDANFSSKNLTTLKSTYIKLRYLQDTGVVFVGHGLKNDFRVINLVVPPEQVVDTVHLFHLPHHRMVSLRFLAWHFLGLNIQSETHDSTEDARTALLLYRCYMQLQAQKRIGSALVELYETGNRRNWKVPNLP